MAITLETTLTRYKGKLYCSINTISDTILIKMNNVTDISEQAEKRSDKGKLTLSLDYIIAQFVELHPDIELTE